MKRLTGTRVWTLIAAALLVAIGLGLCLTGPAGAADPPAGTQAWFLQLEGIKGESRDVGHKDWIEILSFQWGLERPVGAAGGAGMAAGALNRHDLVVTKYVDLTTPKLVEAVARGTHFRAATLSVCERTSAGTIVEYLKITMTDVVVTSVGTGGQCGSTRPTDTVALAFSRVSVQATGQSPTGTATTTVQTNWDFTAGRPY